MNASQPLVGDEHRRSFVAPVGARKAAAPDDDRRSAMVRRIEKDTRRVAARIGKSALDRRVIAAMRRVPRHRFVPAGEERRAYESSPLPIGYGQTVSEPFIVALMADLLALEGGDTVLEIGTGCGYQAAVLAEIAARVYSVEIISELAVSAQHRLSSLGYHNVRVRAGDGHKGWPEHAPYDAAVVTAAANAVPPAVAEQLRPGGRLVIPLRAALGEQWLVLATKIGDDTLDMRRILPVAFVPLTGCRSWPS